MSGEMYSLALSRVGAPPSLRYRASRYLSARVLGSSCSRSGASPFLRYPAWPCLSAWASGSSSAGFGASFSGATCFGRMLDRVRRFAEVLSSTERQHVAVMATHTRASWWWPKPRQPEGPHTIWSQCRRSPAASWKHLRLFAEPDADQPPFALGM